MNNRILRLEFEVATAFIVNAKNYSGEERSVMSNSSSGVEGVRRSKGRWVAYAYIGGKSTYLGLYNTVEHASQAVKAKRNIKKELVG